MTNLINVVVYNTYEDYKDGEAVDEFETEFNVSLMHGYAKYKGVKYYLCYKDLEAPLCGCYRTYYIILSDQLLDQ